MTANPTDWNDHTPGDPGPLETDAVRLGLMIADALNRIDGKLAEILAKLDQGHTHSSDDVYHIVKTTEEG